MGKASGYGDGIVQSMIRLVSITRQISMKCISKEVYRVISGTRSLRIKENHLWGFTAMICQIYPHPVLR